LRSQGVALALGLLVFAFPLASLLSRLGLAA